MKKLMMMVMMATIAAAANAMTYSQARQEALFLTDKMAYELNLTEMQYEAVYEINLDYMMAVTSYSNVYGAAWSRRNSDLRYVLTAYQFDRYMESNYFYRPVYWDSNRFIFRIYSAYANRAKYYRPRPVGFDTYRGGHNVGGSSFYVNWNSRKTVPQPNYNRPVQPAPQNSMKPSVATSNHGTIQIGNGNSNMSRQQPNNNQRQQPTGTQPSNNSNRQQPQGTQPNGNSRQQPQSTRSATTSTTTNKQGNSSSTTSGRFGGRR